MKAALRIGASSWTSEAWWGKVYPRTLTDGERLGWYARLYNCVEVDSSYYRVPPRGMVLGWRQRTPGDFLFTLKLTRDLLDPKKEVDREQLALFLGNARLLGDKLGCILLQFPPWVRPGRTHAFLTELWDALDPGVRYAVELRDAAWFRGEELTWVRRHLTDRRISFVWSYLTYVDVPPEVTSDQVYLRFIGDHTTVPAESHGEVRVDRTPEVRLWSDRVRQVEEKVLRVFVFFNNHFAGFAPASINLFRTTLGLPPVDLALRSAQRTLTD